MKFRTLFLATSSIAAATLLSWAVYRQGFEDGRFPKESELVCSEETITAAHRSEYGANLDVVDQPSRLHYSKKSGEEDVVVDALVLQANQPVTVCFHDMGFTPDEIRFEVFEARSGARMIRSYAQIREAWRKNGRYVFGLFPVILLPLIVFAYRTRNK